MRRLLLLTTLFSLVLALAPGAQAAERSDVRSFLGTDTEWVGLERGRGWASLSRSQGVIIGRVGVGSIRVVARRGSTPRVPEHCPRERHPNRRTVVCRGTDLAIETSREARVVFRGARVNVSAAMQGTLRLEGTRGRYQIGNRGWSSWPRFERRFSIGG